MKKLLCYFAAAILLYSCQNTPPKTEDPSPTILGYEIENDRKVAIVNGDQESLKVIEQYFEAYNNKDLKTVASLEHEDVIFYTHTAVIIEGSEKHMELSKGYLENYPNAQWDIIWSISAQVSFETKAEENWVTTCLNVSYGTGENKQNVQRIVDTQIMDNKIKKVYLYQRQLTESEIN